ncbi:magnesium transporter CorA, partial [Klebsiella pneumoniae]
LVVTARFKPLRFIEWMLPRLQTLRVNTSTELLAFLLEEQEEVLEQVVRQASRHVDLIEERLLSNHLQANRGDLAGVRLVLYRCP